MTVEIPEGFALVAWEFQMAGDPQPWFCTLGVHPGHLDEDPVVNANDMFIAWRDHLLPNQSSTCSLSQVIMKFGHGAEPPTVAYSSMGSSPGETGGGFLPQNCALLVDKLTNSGGRRNRGRFYIPAALPEGQVDNVGNIDTGVMTGWITGFIGFYNDLITGIAPLDFIYNPYIFHAEGISAIPSPTLITSFRVQPTISTQRKRLR